MDEYTIKFEELISETVKYYFIKSIVHNTVNVVKDTTFRVCSLIEKNEDYIAEYHKNIESDIAPLY